MYFFFWVAQNLPICHTYIFFRVLQVVNRQKCRVYFVSNINKVDWLFHFNGQKAVALNLTDSGISISNESLNALLGRFDWRKKLHKVDRALYRLKLLDERVHLGKSLCLVGIIWPLVEIKYDLTAVDGCCLVTLTSDGWVSKQGLERLCDFKRHQRRHNILLVGEV